MKTLWNDKWLFTEQELQGVNFSLENTPKASWSAITLPHDWLIFNSAALYRDSEGWYKKTFTVTEKELAQVNVLEFDGIYLNCQIYLNGKLIKIWKNGYTNFSVNLNANLRIGENELFVRVIHQAPNSRWYSGAGIYRNVWWHSLPAIYCAPHEWYASEILLDEAKQEWKLELDVLLTNAQARSEKITITQELFFQNKRILVKENQFEITEKETQVKASMVTLLNDVKLWSPETPNLYNLRVKIISQDGCQILEEKIGFKYIHLTTDRGMEINGHHLKIQGVCQHHDLGALGSAFNKAALVRQFKTLKAMGVNAIRTSHNPAATEFIELADEMGFLVQSEFTDVWKHPKTTYDYAQYFDEWVDEDVKNWVRRDRNHPCVFMWSIGNEIYDTHGRDDGLATMERLKKLVETYDPKGNAVITFGSNYLLWENTQKVADHLKIVGYNYGESMYEDHHQKFPDWVIYGSETGSVVQSRGIYHFPFAQSILADDDEQCSSLGNSTTSWGAKSVEQCIIKDRDLPFSLGQFVWTGTDYIGEPTPYHTKNSYFGQVDTAGFAKDSYYVFQAAWTDYKKAPMIHLFPYWDFSNGQKIDLRLCSNAPEVELFYNGVSLGRRKNDVYHGEKIIHDWQIPYQVGTLKAVGYDENNTVIAEDEVSSFGDVTQLKISADKTNISGDGVDLVFLEINGLDAAGRNVENANNEIVVSVAGSGQLVGLDNGDSTDYRSYKGHTKRLFSGKLIAMVAATAPSGQIEITVMSPEVKAAQIIISVDEKVGATEQGQFTSEKVAGLDQEVEKGEAVHNIPIRKIALTPAVSTRVLNKEMTKVQLLATVYPKDADSQALEWRLTDEKGIDSDLAELIVEGQTATIKAKSNGTVYVRCGCHNGKEALDLYTQLDFAIEGLQEAYLNPYEFISGGRYTRSNLPMTNGNERGVATLRGEESWVTYDQVNFGTQGAREITLSLFPLEANPFEIEVWQGYPDESGSVLMGKVFYDLGSIWNTYQEVTCTLNQLFKGIQTITFVLRQKVHIKGFSFVPETRAFTPIQVVDNDYIYGDQYQLLPDKIAGIGNNVILGFANFDFGNESVDGISILGNAPTTKNSIQLKISEGEQTEVFLLDFEQSAEVQAKEFALPTFSGKKKLEFVFLPGANFNFVSFQMLHTVKG